MKIQLALIRSNLVSLLQSGVALAFESSQEKRLSAFDDMRGEVADIIAEIDGGDGAAVEAVFMRAHDDDDGGPANATPTEGGDIARVSREDLHSLVNMARRFSRYSKENRVPSKEQRVYLHRAIKRVKHLI